MLAMTQQFYHFRLEQWEIQKVEVNIKIMKKSNILTDLIINFMYMKKVLS